MPYFSMKLVFSFLLAGALTAPAVFADEEPSIAHLPAAVQQTIRGYTAGGELKKVKTVRNDSGTVYEVEYKKRGDEKELVIGSDGRVISEKQGKGDKGKGRGKDKDRKDRDHKDWKEDKKRYDGRKERIGNEPVQPSAPSRPGRPTKVMRYSELPLTVRQVAEQNLRGGNVERVERLIQNEGEIIYDLLFLKDNSQYQRMVVAEDGRVLRNEAVAGPSAGAITSVPIKVMQFSELPEDVRRAAGQHLRNGHVQRVERSVQGGELRYDFLFRKDNGEIQRLVLAEDGRVLRNDVATQ